MYIFNITDKHPILRDADQTISVRVAQSGASDGDVAANLAPIENITGWTLRWHLVEHLGATIALTKATNNGITIVGVYNVDPALNTQYAVITLSAADAALADDIYDHGLWRTDNGANTPLCKGTAVVVAVP